MLHGLQDPHDRTGFMRPLKKKKHLSLSDHQPLYSKRFFLGLIVVAAEVCSLEQIHDYF